VMLVRILLRGATMTADLVILHDSTRKCAKAAVHGPRMRQSDNSMSLNDAQAQRILPKVSALFSAALVPLLGGSMACGHGSPRDFEIIAPTFDVSRVRFASYAYAPVGAFAETHGDLMPFMDANGDGSFDPQTEAAGRCDRRSRQCWLAHARLRLFMTTTDCLASTGTWLLGNVYDRDGRGVDATLCDNHGACSEPHPHAFQGAETANAIWIPDAPDVPRNRTFSLRAGQEDFHYDDVTLPTPIHLVDMQREPRGDLHVSITVDQSIDMASLWVRRGQAVQWSSAGQPGAFHVEGAALEVTLPRSVVDSCGDTCEVYLQIAHVWRDDAILSLSEIKQKIL
jgi:hypothetical protein